MTFELRGKSNTLIVDYTPMSNAEESGFSALQLPFDANLCTGYPMLHAYFDNLSLKGYERYCGWIQMIQRKEYHFLSDEIPANISYQLDVSEEMMQKKWPYFAIGYPAELFDAPCRNLGDSAKLVWTAYTYLVDPPSRMNQNALTYLSGFSWGYMEDANCNVELLPFRMLTSEDWNKHRQYVGL